jgi:Fe-S-cluster containining protein
MDAPGAADSTGLTIRATVGSYELKMTVKVPTGPARVDDFLPLLQFVSNHVASAAEQEASQRGLSISCRKGCGACCRQLVPIAPVEARHIARLVSDLPEPRQTEVRRRFDEARQRLTEAGVWDGLENRQSWPQEGITEFGTKYFRAGVACPFLEDESCSIHPDRPLACREYLVTSPAENCANPSAESIDRVPIATKVWRSAALCEPGATSGKFVNWVPLIQSLEWAASHPEPPPEKTGPELLRQIIEGVTKSSRETV